MNSVHPNTWVVQARDKLKLTGDHMNQPLGSPADSVEC